jgi:menaquinone-9 beta-reductase
MLRAVMTKAKMVSHVGCVAPRGGRVEVPGELAVLPRKLLDDLLCRAAVLSGARMVAPARFVETVESGGRVVGARLRGSGSVQDIRARWVVLATGAVPQATLAAGMCERQLPSGVALRGYVRNTQVAKELRVLDIVWHRALRPGYGWVFPCGGDLYNIGVGVSHSHKELAGGRASKKGDANLREIFDTFTRIYAPARALMDGGEMLGDLKGAPLRCTLEGARLAKPGLLVTGEAAGSTYSFTGEGIGKALETGMMAAEALLSGGEDAMVMGDYEAAVARLKPRFALYERANFVNEHPWLADLLIWRARNNPRLLQRMSGVLNETSNPGNLVSAKGLMRLITG